MIVRLEAACNNNCRVCTGGLPPGRVIFSQRDLEGIGSDSSEPLVLRGKEPTMLADLPDTLRLLGGADRVVLHSNGRRMAYQAYADEIASLVRRVVVSLAGPDDSLHDWFTRTPGSFEQSLKGISHLVARHLPVTIRVPVGGHNVTFLDALVDLASDLGVDRIRFVRLSQDMASRSGDKDASAVGIDSWFAGPFVAAAARRAWSLGLEVETQGIAPGDMLGLSAEERSRIQVPDAEPESPAEPDGSGPGTHAGCIETPPVELVGSLAAAPAWQDETKGQIRLVVRSTCTNACQFCTTRILHEERNRPWPVDRTTEVLFRLLDGLCMLGRTDGRAGDGPLVRFVALEPAEHPDIDILVAAARRWSGGLVQVDSSGRRFADSILSARLVALGLGKVDLALLGPNAEVHDRVAGAEGAFEELTAGLGNLRGNVALTGHMVVVRDNAGFVVETLRWARAQGVTVTHLSFAAPASRDLKRYAQVAVFLPDFVASLLGRGREGRRALALGAAEIPPCLLPSTLTAFWSAPPPSGGRLTHPEGFSLGADLKARRPCPLAESCLLSARCPGLFPQYLDLFGTEGLVPIK